MANNSLAAKVGGGFRKAGDAIVSHTLEIKTTNNIDSLTSEKGGSFPETINATMERYKITRLAYNRQVKSAQSANFFALFLFHI